MTTDTMTPEAVQDTQQEYLRVATATGEFGGAVVEFSMDGLTWHDVILGEEHPAAVRATVHRVGRVLPTVATFRWDEVFPADEAWRALWMRKPHVFFGAFALRAGLRRGFPDVLGGRREPDDAPTAAPAAVEPPAPATGGHPGTEGHPGWMAAVAAASTAEAIHDIRARARAAGEVDRPLFLAIKERLREVSSTANAASEPEVWAAPADSAPRPKPTAPPAAPERPTAVAEAYREAEERKAATTEPTPRTKRTRRSNGKGRR